MLNREANKISLFIFIAIGIMLSLISGLRPIGIDPDSKVYIDYYNTAVNGYSMAVGFEPTFMLLSFISSWLTGDVRGLLIMYAIIGVFIKLYAIKKHSPYPFFSLLIYLSMYFFLHEMTQIRVGVASGLALLSLDSLSNGRKKEYVAIIIIACLFHSSAAIMFPLALLSREKLNVSMYMVIMLVSLILPKLINVNDTLRLVFSNVPGFIGTKVIIYIDMIEKGINQDINPYRMVYISLITIVMFFLIMSKYVCFSNKENILIKINVLSIASLYSLSSIPILATRVSELFGVFFIISIPCFLKYFKQWYVLVMPFSVWLLIYFVQISMPLLKI